MSDTDTTSELQEIRFKISFTQRQIDDMKPGVDIEIGLPDEAIALLAAQKQRWKAAARISELERLTVKHNKKSVGDTDCSVVNVLLAERIAELQAALDGVIGEPLGSSQSAVDASAQGHEAGNLSAESAPEEGER